MVLGIGTQIGTALFLSCLYVQSPKASLKLLNHCSDIPFTFLVFLELSKITALYV